MSEEESNKPFKWLIACLAIILAGVVTYIWKDEVTELFQPKTEIVTPVVDSIAVETPPTIDEIVSLRREIIENRKIDSVYLSMSDLELTAILMKIGTNTTITEIVEAYETLKPQLKDVLLGANIAEKLIKEQTSMQHLDTVPAVPLPARTLPSIK